MLLANCLNQAAANPAALLADAVVQSRIAIYVSQSVAVTIL